MWRVSLIIVWRYFRFFISDSCTHFSLSILVSNSSWPIFRTFRWFNSNESAHVKVIAVLLEVMRIRFCEKVGCLNSRCRIICWVCYAMLCYMFKRKCSGFIINLWNKLFKENNDCGTQECTVWLSYTHGLYSMSMPSPHKEHTFKQLAFNNAS